MTENDEVLWKGTPQMKGVVDKFVGAVIGAVVVGVIASVYSSSVLNGVFLFSGILIVGNIGTILFVKRTEYTLTNRAISMYSGGLSKSNEEIPLNKIESVTVRKSILQQRFGDYGTVIISSAGSDGQEVRLDGIERADDVHDAITKKLEEKVGDTEVNDQSDTVPTVLAEARKLRQTAENLTQETDNGEI